MPTKAIYSQASLILPSRFLLSISIGAEIVLLRCPNLLLVSQDESSIAAHLGERAARTADAESVALDNGDDAQDVQVDDLPEPSGGLPFNSCSHAFMFCFLLCFCCSVATFLQGSLGCCEQSYEGSISAPHCESYDSTESLWAYNHVMTPLQSQIDSCHEPLTVSCCVVPAVITQLASQFCHLSYPLVAMNWQQLSASLLVAVLVSITTPDGFRFGMQITKRPCPKLCTVLYASGANLANTTYSSVSNTMVAFLVWNLQKAGML